MSITEAIWKEYHQQLRAFIRQRINNHAVADDILQDIFLRIHKQQHSIREKIKLKSWLYQITRNAVIDYYRTRKPSEELPTWIVQPEVDPVEQTKSELAACLLPMIKQLPAHYRDALILSEIESMTQKEVSQKQGLSLSGAKSRVQRGRSLLKEMILECCRLEFDYRGQPVDYQTKQDRCDSC